ncbi:MAG: hypothetical protein PHD67_06660, partial [Oscillospiraceae bacterium]|nr:hypothetical protein [Oscillospiraceae bacterium]
MKEKQIVPRLITYDQLRQDPTFPQSRMGFVKWFFRNLWQGIKAGFPVNLLIFLGVALFYWLFNLFFLSYVNDSCFFGNGRFASSSIIAYIFAGLVYKNSGLKGFDVMLGPSTTTWFYNFSMMLFLALWVGGLFRRI